jgi:hypothetical protein
MAANVKIFPFDISTVSSLSKATIRPTGGEDGTEKRALGIPL